MNTLISCQNINKYFGSKHALQNVNVEICRGAPVALVGPNGAGKTTLFSILCGYISATTGSVEVFGKRPGNILLSGKLAALPQDAQLDPRFSISHQLRFYCRLQGINHSRTLEESLRVLEMVNLKEVIDEKPGALSHGMRKRVSIAQSLIGNPQMILLDEPTAGLDPENARNIRSLVNSLSDKITFIISSHNLHELEKLCHQVIFLENGQLRQNLSQSSNTDSDYITLTIKSHDPEKFKQQLSQMNGFEKLDQVQSDEYIIQYNQQSNPQFDWELIRMISANGWNYHQLIKGKTLEEQLFSRT